MKFIVTGATGFVGTHLVEKLLKEKHEVIAILRNSIPSKNLLSASAKSKNFIPYIIDSTHPYNMSIPFKTYGNLIDGVFHLSAFTHPGKSFEQPLATFNTNTALTLNVCNAMENYSPEATLMHCSTCEVYGVTEDIITENTPFNPMNPYAVSKAASELYVSERFRNNFLKGFITRAFSHTGPGRRENYSISSDAIQIARILQDKQEPVIKVGNLDAERVVIDVRDVVNAYYELMMAYKEGKLENGEAFNISGDLEKLMRIGAYLDIMLEISKLKNTTLEVDPTKFRPIDIPIQRPDCSKIKEKIGWEPLIPIETTLTDLLDYWGTRV